MKVLLADDDQDQLELRSLLLTRSGFETIQATNGAAALKAAIVQKPECAVVDLWLPTEELGLGLIRALKELNSAICVIVLTGGNPNRLDRLPEKKLVEEVIVKGASTVYLLQKLAALAGSPDRTVASLIRTLAQEGSVIFDVKVMPRSSKSEVIGLTTDGGLKIKLAAVPDSGKANEELIALLAERFQLPKRKVEIIMGETAQRKRIKLSS